MTTAEKTLKWWNDYKKMNGTYPLIAEIEAQLQMAVNEEKLVKNCSIPYVVGQSEQLVCDHSKHTFFRVLHKTRKCNGCGEIYEAN